MKRRPLAVLGGLLTFAIIACQQNTSILETTKVLGTLELSMSNGLVGQAKFIPAKLKTQAILNESQLVFTPTDVASFFAETNASRNFDYVSRNFTITNKTGATINNLTLVALAKTGNLGGTAIKTATAFNGNATDAATAQLARPTHTMLASGGGAVVDDQVDLSRASFQALTTAEATAIQNDANFASQGLTGTVLEYGFAATNSTATNRTIANNSSGKVSIAMRFPKPSTATNTYNFTMTFAVTAESANRVTRSPEDTTAKANARATTLGATQKVLIDDPAVITGANIPSGYTVQSNVKIGTGGTQTLLKKSAKLVIARVYTSSSLSGTPTYNGDFVEIFNLGEFSSSLSGKSLQFATAANNLGTDVSPSTNTVNVSSLGVVSPGEYKLVALQAPTLPVGTTSTPSGDLTPAPITDLRNLGGGKVALVNQTAALNCGGGTGGTSPVTCTGTQDGLILDLLGYVANVVAIPLSKSEGTALTYASSPSTTQALTRNNNGCTDSDVNNNDFSITTIISTSARSSSSPVFICP